MPEGTLRYVRIFEFLDFFIRELHVHGTYGFVFKILPNNRLPALLPSNSVKFAKDVVPTIGAETPRHRDIISNGIVLSERKVHHLLLTPMPGRPEPYLYL